LQQTQQNVFEMLLAFGKNFAMNSKSSFRLSKFI